MPALTAERALPKVEALLKTLAGRQTEIRTDLEYFSGKHPLAYATKEWESAHARRFANFSDNWCGVVGSAPSERTIIDGFRLGHDSDPISDVERQLDYDWQSNEMPMQASQGFQMSTVTGRSAVLVWGDQNSNPVMSWERPDQVVVDYDPGNPRMRRAGLKSWVEDECRRATLYTADAVYKFRGARSALALPSHMEPYQPAEDDSWPIPNPLGEVPLVEFPNQPMLGAEPISDIQGAIAMQDAINLLWEYLFTAADWAAMPARVVMGQEPPKIPILDANGQKVGEKAIDSESLTRGRMLWLTGQNTKIGQWEAAKLDVFTDVITVALKHLSTQTRTPMPELTGEMGNVNGDTLQGLQQPLAMKVRRSQTFYTPRVRDVYRLAALVRGDAATAAACRTGLVQWRNPEIFSESQIADAASKDRSIGFPLQWIAEKRYGYSQGEIERLLMMVKAEQDDPYLSALSAKDTASVSEAG